MAGEEVQQFFADMNTRIRDIEEKQRLLKDRILLIGQNLVSEREQNFSELQEIKKIVLKLDQDNKRVKESLTRISEQISDLARKEELMILQRQFDIIKGIK